MTIKTDGTCRIPGNRHSGKDSTDRWSLRLRRMPRREGDIMQKRIHPFGVVLLTGIMLISCIPVYGQIGENYWENKKKAFTAATRTDCRTSLKFCIDVLKENPDHPVMNYLAARLQEQLGRRDLALTYLKKAAALGYTSHIRWLDRHPVNDPAFSTLRKEEAFIEIIKIMNISDKPIHGSRIAFVVKDKTIGTEGITYDPVGKIFYLGSEKKIVKVDHLGNSAVFTINAKEDGLGSVNGIHVDPVRRFLWACSRNGDRTEVFRYRLSSGKLIKKYPAPSDGNRHFFNDLVIHPNGDIYITDIGAICRILHDSDQLEPFYKSTSFFGANGITLAADSRTIFVTEDVHGICKIDIGSKTMIPLTHEKNFHLYGIDGLYFKKNHLYAIQNELLTQVSRFSLNADGTHLESCDIFEKNTDDLRAPTTGVIVDDYFYFIADTQGKKSKKQGIVVMKTPIKDQCQTEKIQKNQAER